MLTDDFDLLLRTTMQSQGPYQETVVGGGARVFVTKRKANELALQLGAHYRYGDFGDAVIPVFEIMYGPWEVGLSYDVNTSEFQAATNRQGGPEVSVRYIITRIKPAPLTKICPII